LSKYKLLIFTSNKGKILEIKKLLPKKQINIITLQDNKKSYKIKEVGKTFKENAIIKSMYGFKILQLPCIAEDSGICIDSMNGKPGVESNRYQKKLGGYNRANRKIIEITRKKLNFSASFNSVISFTYKKNRTVTFCGSVKGKINNKMVGKKGFGYDPIFIPNNSFKTFGQMSKYEKNKFSHRGLAIRNFIKYLEKIIL